MEAGVGPTAQAYVEQPRPGPHATAPSMGYGGSSRLRPGRTGKWNGPRRLSTPPVVEEASGTNPHGPSRRSHDYSFPAPCSGWGNSRRYPYPLWCLPILWEDGIFGVEGQSVYTIHNTCTWPLPWTGADAHVVAAYDGERGPVRPQLVWPIRSAIGTDFESPFGPDHDVERLRGAKVVPDDRLWSH